MCFTNKQNVGICDNKYMDPMGKNVLINIYIYIHTLSIYIYIYIVFTYIHIAFTYIHGISWLFLLVDVTVVDSLGINHITQCFIRCCVFRAK